MSRHAHSRAAAGFLAISALLALTTWLGLSTTASASVSNDAAFDGGLQWGLSMIGAPQTWDKASGSGQIIGVIDSGVRLDHEDLSNKLVPGVACLGTKGDVKKCSGSANDQDGHGTHVAGIAAAERNNGVGIIGVAPDAKIMPVRVLSKDCADCEATGTAEDVTAGIHWAVEHGADVLNLSVGSSTDAVLGPSFASAVEYAWSKGVIVVVAAGNDYVLSSGFTDQNAIVVTAVDNQKQVASYANGVGRSKWAISAPGGSHGDTVNSCSTGGSPLGILSTWSSSRAGYACLSGTSMAAPHVAGAAAILLSTGLTPTQVVDRLLTSADPIGPSSTYGAGLLDLANAMGVVTVAPTTSQSPTTVATAATSSPTSNGATPTTTPPNSAVPQTTPAESTPPTQSDSTVPGGTTTTTTTTVVTDTTTAPPEDAENSESAYAPNLPEGQVTNIIRGQDRIPWWVAATAVGSILSSGIGAYNLRRRQLLADTDMPDAFFMN